MVNTKIIRVPERKYIQTLIVGRTNASLVIDDLQSHRIPVPTNDMKALFDEVANSNPNYFKDASLTPEDEWLESLAIAPMYYYRFKKASDISLQGCEGAFKMLDDPKLVKHIHTLAIAGVPKDDIELILNSKYDISYETPDFTIFLHYFANYEGWTRTDKELYINTLQDQDLKKQYKMAITEPRNRMIWEIGLGTDPNASFDDMLKDMFTDSYFYFKKNLKFNADDAQKFAALAVKLSDRMASLDETKKEQTDIFAEMKFKLVNEDTQESDKRNVAVKDISEMDVEIPERTENKIQNLDALMNNEGMKNVFEE